RRSSGLVENALGGWPTSASARVGPAAPLTRNGGAAGPDRAERCEVGATALRGCTSGRAGTPRRRRGTRAGARHAEESGGAGAGSDELASKKGPLTCESAESDESAAVLYYLQEESFLEG